MERYATKIFVECVRGTFQPLIYLSFGNHDISKGTVSTLITMQERMYIRHKFSDRGFRAEKGDKKRKPIRKKRVVMHKRLIMLQNASSDY